MTDSTLTHLGDDFIDLIARRYPVVATALGIHDYDGHLGSYRETTMTELGSELRLLRQRAGGIEPGALSAQARIDHQFLLHQLDTALLEVEGMQWWRRNPEFAVDLVLSGLFFLVSREFAPAGDRAAALASRLREVPSFLAESRATLSDTPRELVSTAAQSAAAGADFIAGTITQWAAALNGAGAAVRDAVTPAAEEMRAHARWLRDEFLARCSAPVAIGEELLGRAIANRHLLDDSPDEIAHRGEQMLERLGAEINDVARTLGFPDWQSAVADVKRDVPPHDGLIQAYAESMAWTERMVREHDLATVLDDAPLEVRETPPFWRHTLPYAAYEQPAPFDVEQGGIFWVTPPDGDSEKLKGHARSSIPVVALHEGYPGHHLQLTRANRHPSRLRRLADSALLIEGWAFYCEEMAHEQGLLSPESRLCQLKDELWRACRVVIDMRLHQGEMSAAEAVDMLVAEAGLERPNAEAEVRRYAYTPAYQMSYAIGKEEILRLREQVRRAEGPNFELKRFHDRVLGEGSLPTPLIARALFARD